MDIAQIRMLNYQALLTQFSQRPDQEALPTHGLLTRFADHAGVSVKYLSHINAGRKKIGPTVARQLEAGCGVPHGWLDNHHEADIDMVSDIEKKFMATMLELFRESPQDTQQMLTEYLMKKMRSQKK